MLLSFGNLQGFIATLVLEMREEQPKDVETEDEIHAISSQVRSKGLYPTT